MPRESGRSLQVGSVGMLKDCMIYVGTIYSRRVILVGFIVFMEIDFMVWCVVLGRGWQGIEYVVPFLDTHCVLSTSLKLELRFCQVANKFMSRQEERSIGQQIRMSNVWWELDRFRYYDANRFPIVEIQDSMIFSNFQVIKSDPDKATTGYPKRVLPWQYRSTRCSTRFWSFASVGWKRNLLYELKGDLKWYEQPESGRTCGPKGSPQGLFES